MTVFSTLKYPISCPPTAEQLEALPPGLIEKFLDRESFPLGSSEDLSPADVAHFIKFFYNHNAGMVRNQAVEMCNMLRKEVQELDE